MLLFKWVWAIHFRSVFKYKIELYRMRTCQNAPWCIVVARHIDPDGIMMVIITWWWHLCPAGAKRLWKTILEKGIDFSTKLNYYRMRICQNGPWCSVVARHIDPDGIMMVIITWWWHLCPAGAKKNQWKTVLPWFSSLAMCSFWASNVWLWSLGLKSWNIFFKF